MTSDEMISAIQAMLFVAGDPVERAELARALDCTAIEVDAALERMQSRAADERLGLCPVFFGERVQLCTSAAYAHYIDRLFEPAPPKPLSQSALETLSVIAYRQPVTRGDIEQVRGVKCDYSVSVLLNKGLIREAGRRDALGRPILYATTDLFLRHFGLHTIADLPALPDPTPVDPAAEPGAE